tara:strand:+ start:105 stop:1358 length:1254 start_codon:yes stop_codon:yes gene_type:complete
MGNILELNNNSDHDEIRKELVRQGLTYPNDSTDPRYRSCWEYIRHYNINTRVQKNYDFFDLALESHEFSQRTQCRENNIDTEKVENYAIRFENGEKLLNPIIGIYHEGSFFPVFGNQRSRGMKQAGRTTSIIVIGENLSYADKKFLASRISNMSNRQTNLDVDKDSREDIIYQMQVEWDLVMESGDNETTVFSLPYQQTRDAYLKATEESEIAAIQVQRKHFDVWFYQVKPDTLAEDKEKRKRQLGKFFSDAFNENIKQRLSSGFHNGNEQAIYNSFWSSTDVDGEGEELYIWDTKVHSFSNDSKTVQMDARCGNPKQNSITLVLYNMYQEKCSETVEIMLRPHQGMKDIDKIVKYEKDCRKIFANHNNGPKRREWKLPLFDKLIFLQHTTDGHKTTAWEWKKTANSGFWQQVKEIV